MGTNQHRTTANAPITNRKRSNSQELSLKKKKELQLKRRKRRVRKRLFSILLILLLLITVGAVFKIIFTLGNVKRTELDNDNLGISDKFNKNSLNYSDAFGDIVNIALFGLDEEVDNIQRSDSIMIGTLDNTHSKLKVTSLMRDSYVNIPKHGYDKLNHAYAYGGPELSIATINKNFDLNITDYVAVDFSELESIIDAIGGISMELDNDEIIALNEYMSEVYAFYNQPNKKITKDSNGLVKLTGFEALGYSRNRSTAGGDFERTQRQRNLMEAIFNKISSFGVGKLATIMTKLLPYVETSLSNSEILTLGTQVLSIGNFNIEQARFPRDENSENSIINEIFYFTFDEDITRKELYEYIFKDNKTWETQKNTNTN